jgi:hypothetical protein
MNLSGGGIGIYDDADYEHSWIAIFGDRDAEREIEKDVIRNGKFTMPKGTLTRLDHEDFEFVDEQGRKLTIHAPFPMAQRLIHHEDRFEISPKAPPPTVNQSVFVWLQPIRYTFGKLED